MFIKYISAFIMVCVLSACQSTPQSKKGYEWDFDHQLQYKQQQLSENRFSLEVVSNDKTSFSRLATFLLRQSYRVCGSYGFTLEIINGVEGFDDRRVSSSYIQPNLSAELECPTQ